MSSVHITNLDSFVTPAHNLTGANVSHRSRHLAPLQHNVLAHLTARVYVHTFVIVAKQQLHTFRVWQCDNRMRLNCALTLSNKTENWLDICNALKSKILHAVEYKDRSAVHCPSWANEILDVIRKSLSIWSSFRPSYRPTWVCVSNPWNFWRP